MKAALFLDVDNTLTEEPIQKAFATALGCESQYAPLEEKFTRGHISAAKFGDELIKLYAERNFTDKIAATIFPKVKLQPWADELLSLPVDRYLVSSGPNYYIDRLAEKYNIPIQNVCRSEYIFNKETGVIESCKARDRDTKDLFVSSHTRDYDITIGIGDNPTLDSFVSRCTISLLTMSPENSRSNTNILIPNFSAVINLIHKLLGEVVLTDPKLGQVELTDSQQAAAAVKYPNIASPLPAPGEITVGDIVSKMKVSQAWAVLVALGTVIAAVFGTAFYLGQRLGEAPGKKSEIQIERGIVSVGQDLVHANRH
jgi:phosphoserine phosphatase